MLSFFSVGEVWFLFLLCFDYAAFKFNIVTMLDQALLTLMNNVWPYPAFTVAVTALDCQAVAIMC